jgi:outer membrane protein assembly factor BamB
VAIVVPCPHCGTRFNLPADMSGKQTKCPNLGCRKPFVVKALQEKAPPEPDLFELPPEPEAPPPPPKPKAPKPAAAAEKPPQPKPPKPKPAPLPPPAPTGAVIEAEVFGEPEVKEVVWSEGTDVPPPPPAEPKKKKPAKPADDGDDDAVPVRRKKKSNRRPLVLAGMAIVAVGLVVFAIIYALGMSAKKEDQLAAKAKEHYEKGEYQDATKAFDLLVKEYPDGKKVGEYKFFAALSQMQSAVRSVTNRDDYEPGVKKLNEFVAAHKDEPLAKPGTGFGRDVLEAGKKLGEDVAAHAADRVKAYQSDRAGKAGELARAERAVAAGRALVPVLDPFRGPDDGPLVRVTGMLDDAEKGVKRERDRTAALDRARAQLENPTDAVIQAAEAELAQAGFLEDAEAQALIATAKGRLRELVKYEPDAAEPQPAPPTAAASLLFVTPVGKDKLRTADPNDPPPGAFLCVARGILYALDEDTGALLWAARVGPDVTDPPAVARVPLADGLTDLAVVASNVGNAPALTGQVLRTGAVRWYQPLPAPAAGPPVVIGARAFVPLRDAIGTVYEFDLSTGARLGKIRLGQPVAERGAVLRPGTNLLYVPADARRLYVIDAGGKDDDGNRVNPRCAQAIATGHVAGALRVPPVFVGPDGLEDAQRFVILCVADGTARTQVRAYPVTAVAPGGGTVAETTAVPVASLPVPGWVAFPPVTDGERLALVTDTGHVRLFGVNQPGNADKPLFALPAPPAVGNPERPTPGLLVPVEEATYWAVAGGQIQKARLALVTNKGQEVVFAGAPVPAGEPVHAAQVNARRDTACAVVRALASSGVRAIAFDARTGDVRWQRQLGLVPAKGHAPVAQGTAFVLVDEEGSAVAVPAESGATAGRSVLAKPEWVLGAPPAGATGPTVVATGPNGKVVFAVTPVTRDVPKFVVRRIENGKLVYESEAAAPKPLAGAPAVVGDALLLPTADGFVNRFVPGDGRVRPGSLVPGPGFRTDRRADSVCTITPLSDAAFATSDGGKRISRWEWPATANAWSLSTAWELRQEAAGAGAAVPPEGDGPPRVLFADAGGGVWAFAADRAGPPLRRWQAGEALPAGRPSAALARNLDASKPAIALVLDGKTVVALDPNRKEALWPTPPTDLAVVGAPQPAAGNRWIVTDLTGRVLVLDGATGAALDAKAVGLPGAVPAGASGASAELALTPLTDGSVVVIELPK